MTKEHYPQPLQSSLDDTEGVAQERISFEPCVGQDYVGMVTLRQTNMKLRVYDAEDLVPDLGLINTSGSGSFGLKQFVSGQVVR